MRSIVWFWCLLAAVGSTEESAQVFQVYDFRRAALVRRDIQILNTNGSKQNEDVHLGFVRPCATSHGWVLDTTPQERVVQDVVTDIRLRLKHAKSDSPPGTGFRLSTFYRLEWDIDPLDLCLDVYVIHNPLSLNNSNLLISGSFFGHSIKAPKLMAWQESQVLEFNGCDAVLASTEMALSAATSMFRVRNGKSNLHSSMGKVFQVKGREDNMFSHARDKVDPSDKLVFELTTEMLQELKASQELELPWNLLGHVARTCYRLSFIYNEALPALDSFVRKIYVPQWGQQLKLEETYQLTNEAAPMKGDYRGSDIHVAMRRLIGTRRSHDFALSGSPILFTFDARVPRSASGFEYYDTIGNISTSHVTRRRDEFLVELEPRYPLLGGWSFGWTLKYLIPDSSWIVKSATTYSISIPWSAAVSGLWADTVTAQVILPPRSKIVNIVTPRKQLDSMQMLTTRRWLDLFTTRPVLQLQWFNVPMLPTNKDVLLAQIQYTTDPFFATLLHAAWFPAIIATVICFVTMQPLIQKFFKLLVQFVETHGDLAKKSELNSFEALVALGDLLRLHFSLSKNEKLRSKGPGTETAVSRVVESLGSVR
eukprot:Gregarina_sp_Poly_1__7103@NODE_388_length_8987_cov_115_762892_g317_i0_p2_GENE_NODE_388_length_8987_cov_115_762892_g317_i0NODE_388_length_8987_cov_115_762892_g317_i0_p2_ORF_typecomplete_len594_score79_26Ribophorin_I/PF04597_14/4_4e47_NODE_388_length_8987_cov_115_762892_g317_i071208901